MPHTRTNRAHTDKSNVTHSNKPYRAHKHTGNSLQHTTTHCNTLQHTATHCNTLQHTATHYNTRQRTATHWNNRRPRTTHQNAPYRARVADTAKGATHCNTLQHTRYTHTRTPPQNVNCASCSYSKQCCTLQHTATHCNTLQNTRYQDNKPPLTKRKLC